MQTSWFWAGCISVLRGCAAHICNPVGDEVEIAGHMLVIGRHGGQTSALSVLVLISWHVYLQVPVRLNTRPFPSFKHVERIIRIPSLCVLLPNFPSLAFSLLCASAIALRTLKMVSKTLITLSSLLAAASGKSKAITTGYNRTAQLTEAYSSHHNHRAPTGRQARLQQQQHNLLDLGGHGPYLLRDRPRVAK